MTRKSILILLGAMLAGLTRQPAAAQEGHRLAADGVEIDNAAQWRHWNYPRDLVTVTADGWIEPRFIQPTTDAVLNADEFTYEISGAHRDLYDNVYQEEGSSRYRTRGGIKRAGTRSEQAANTMDGNPYTYWEPDLRDDPDTWWVEIDLGRLVSATDVILHFAEDSPQERADPFLQFRVHSATGFSPFGPTDESGALDYALVGGTTQPNRDQRVFSFELTPLGRHSEEWTGRVLQYVRIAVTASAKDRAERVSEAEYDDLAAEDRGTVEYVWSIGGEERLVTPERYAQLPTEQQGGVRYYRRERPKLAKVEVLTVGENLALRLLERGGSFHDVNPQSFPERIFDGNIRTEWNALVYRDVGETAEWGLLTVDLGALFWVDMVRLISERAGRSVNLLYGYQLRGSDGSRAPDGSLVWTVLSSDDRLQNTDIGQFADRFAQRRLRYLEFRNLDVARRTRAHLGHRVQSVLNQMQVYGSGYPPETVLRSEIIDLEAARNLTTIEWEAESPPGTRVEIRTRTGNELREVNYYFRSDGSQVASREAYDALPSFFRGPIVTEILPGDDWSGWSQPYLEPGEVVRSPSPRRYMMIQARLQANQPEAAARLRSIRVNFVGALARSVMGEISPKDGVQPGELTEFELYIKPEFDAVSPGIDRLRVEPPSPTPIELQRVRLGTASALLADQGHDFVRQADGRFVDSEGEALDVSMDQTGELEVQLPTMMRRVTVEDDAMLIHLTFRSRVFRSGASFVASVGNSTQPGMWQQVDPGEVVSDELSPGSGLTVMTPLDGPSIQLAEMRSRIFSPNGDGINDEFVFEFAVLKVDAAREVSVDLYDLAGNRVRRLSEIRSSASGSYRMVWDGRNQAGNLVPPGLYLADVRIDSDIDRRNSAQVLVGVTY